MSLYWPWCWFRERSWGASAVSQAPGQGYWLAASGSTPVVISWKEGVLTILRVRLAAVFLVVDQMTSLLRRFVLLLCQAFAQDKFGPVGNCPSGDWEAILVEALAEWVLKPGGGWPNKRHISLWFFGIFLNSIHTNLPTDDDLHLPIWLSIIKNLKGITLRKLRDQLYVSWRCHKTPSCPEDFKHFFFATCWQHSGAA